MRVLHLRTASLLLAVLQVAAIDTETIGAPIEFPAVVTGSGGTVSTTLTLAEYTYAGPGVSQRTRVYNGGLPGPTIRVSAGDTLAINVVNNLPAAAFSTNSLHNEYKSFDVTNLHTHGLHVDSIAPGDSVFIEVAAQSSHAYSYSIPTYHQGGTFW